MTQLQLAEANLEMMREGLFFGQVSHKEFADAAFSVTLALILGE